MTINQIQLANTFDVWRIRTNQLITISNDLKEGNLLSSGTIAISNPSGFENNVSLNVSSGMIYGDGGLLSNVGKPKSIANQKLLNSNVKVTASQRQIILSSDTLELGSTVYLNVANLVTVNTDTSTANIPSANLVNAVHRIATRADITAALAFNKANAANLMAYNALELSNTVNTLALSSSSALSSLALTVPGIASNTILAWNMANTANIRAVAAYTFANTRYSSSGGTISGDVSITGSLSVTGNTYFVDTVTMNIADPLIFLASENPSDIVDVGFTAKYVNATADVVYTGVMRDATNKEYYIFEGYSQEPKNNHIDTAGNNFTISTLNTNLKTTNIYLSGTNVTTWLTSAYNTANAAPGAYDTANTANIRAVAAYTKANNVGQPVPAGRLGAVGDIFGEIAISNTFVYFSTNNYSGSANTWKTIPLREFEEPTPYLMMPYFYGTPGLAAPIFFNAAPFSYYLPASMTGSIVVANNRPAGAISMTITKNGSSVGSINFTGGASGSPETATFTFASRVDFVRGDVLGIINTTSSEAQIQNIMLTILGYRV